MEDAKQKINRFYSLIKNYEPGGPDTRYKSWEWCHKAFLKAHQSNQYDKDNLSLHLAFYLASWGMYRGSSYLLQRDYKAHEAAVEVIMEKQYAPLWDFDPVKTNIEDASKLLFGDDYISDADKVNKDSGLYWRVKYSYRNYTGNEDDASDTLTTKILMGTLGCVPAFDRFFKDGLRALKSSDIYQNWKGRKSVTLGIENKRNNGVTFRALAELVKTNSTEFTLSSNFHYPPMKCLDMYLWEAGYELGGAEAYQEALKKNSNKKKSELINEFRKLGFAVNEKNIVSTLKKANE